MSEKLVCTLLVGVTKRREKTKKIAEKFKNCPYVYFMATNANRLYATLFFHQERSDKWIRFQKEDPSRIFGLDKAKVTLVDNVRCPEALTLRLPEKPQKRAPCGLDCYTCPAYKECRGCPATTAYSGTE